MLKLFLQQFLDKFNNYLFIPRKRSSQEILKLTPCLQGWGFEIFLCYSYKVKYSWISVIISVWKISLAAKLWGLLRPLKTCQIMCIVKARWIPEIQTCQSLPISLLCSFPPKIRDWEFCDEGLDNCGAGNKKETGAFIDLTLQVKSKGTPKKESKKDREKSKKKPICHKNLTCPEVYNLGGGSDVVLNNEVWSYFLHYVYTNWFDMIIYISSLFLGWFWNMQCLVAIQEKKNWAL